MTSTRCGISAKHLERELGVNYKTAWRMLNKIRNVLMEQDGEPLSGDVEVDETAGGAKHARAGDSRRGLAHVKKSRRPTIWGAVERRGRVRVEVVKSRGTIDVEGPIYPRPAVLDRLHGRMAWLHLPCWARLCGTSPHPP
jgi:transposase